MQYVSAIGFSMEAIKLQEPYLLKQIASDWVQHVST